MHELAVRRRAQVIAALNLDYQSRPEVTLDVAGVIVDVTDHGRRLTRTQWATLHQLEVPVGRYPVEVELVPVVPLMGERAAGVMLTTADLTPGHYEYDDAGHTIFAVLQLAPAIGYGAALAAAPAPLEEVDGLAPGAPDAQIAGTVFCRRLIEAVRSAWGPCTWAASKLPAEQLGQRLLYAFDEAGVCVAILSPMGESSAEPDAIEQALAEVEAEGCAA